MSLYTCPNPQNVEPPGESPNSSCDSDDDCVNAPSPTVPSTPLSRMQTVRGPSTHGDKGDRGALHLLLSFALNLKAALKITFNSSKRYT